MSSRTPTRECQSLFSLLWRSSSGLVGNIFDFHQPSSESTKSVNIRLKTARTGRARSTARVRSATQSHRPCATWFLFNLLTIVSLTPSKVTVYDCTTSPCHSTLSESRYLLWRLIEVDWRHCRSLRRLRSKGIGPLVSGSRPQSTLHTKSTRSHGVYHPCESYVFGDATRQGIISAKPPAACRSWIKAWCARIEMPVEDQNAESKRLQSCYKLQASASVAG